MEYLNWTFSSDPMDCEDLSSVTVTHSQGSDCTSTVVPGLLESNFASVTIPTENDPKPTNSHLGVGMKALIAGTNGIVN